MTLDQPISFKPRNYSIIPGEKATFLALALNWGHSTGQHPTAKLGESAVPGTECPRIETEGSDRSFRFSSASDANKQVLNGQCIGNQ